MIWCLLEGAFTKFIKIQTGETVTEIEWNIKITAQKVKETYEHDKVANTKRTDGQTWRIFKGIAISVLENLLA